MTPNEAMEYLRDIADIYCYGLPLTKTTQSKLKEACNLGISALKTIDDMKGEATND